MLVGGEGSNPSPPSYQIPVLGVAMSLYSRLKLRAWKNYARTRSAFDGAVFNVFYFVDSVVGSLV